MPEELSAGKELTLPSACRVVVLSYIPNILLTSTLPLIDSVIHISVAFNKAEVLTVALRRVHMQGVILRRDMQILILFVISRGGPE